MALSTSATLLTRARDPRDEASWATFCARYRPIVVACARGAGMGAWEAEDVAQMVLLDPSGTNSTEYLSLSVGVFV
jgi:hypothetical protein